jgi:hypothetical protein
MNPINNTFNIIKKEYGIITFEKNGLTFDEAYVIATPDYIRAIYPSNKWTITSKMAVFKCILMIENSEIPNWLKSYDISLSDNDKYNKTITVSYEINNSNIKIREFIIQQA